MSAIVKSDFYYSLSPNHEAEPLPVVMSTMDFVNKSESAAIQTMAQIYCKDQKMS